MVESDSSFCFERVKFKRKPNNTHCVFMHDDDIKMLLSRAENEIIHHFGSNGHARHAKTMQQAQHEILVCIGIYVYERLNSVWHAWSSCKQTAPLLAALTLEVMRFKYEEILEDKQGGPMEKYEKLCQELELDDKKEDEKKKKKQEKRQRQRAKKQEQKIKKEEQKAQALEKLAASKKKMEFMKKQSKNKSSNNVSSVGSTENSDDDKMRENEVVVHSWDEEEEEEDNVEIVVDETVVKNEIQMGVNDGYLSDDIQAEMLAFQRRSSTSYEIQKRLKLRERLRAQFEACNMNTFSIK